MNYTCRASCSHERASSRTTRPHRCVLVDLHDAAYNNRDRCAQLVCGSAFEQTRGSARSAASLGSQDTIRRFETVARAVAAPVTRYNVRLGLSRRLGQPALRVRDLPVPCLKSSSFLAVQSPHDSVVTPHSAATLLARSRGSTRRRCAACAAAARCCQCTPSMWTPCQAAAAATPHGRSSSGACTRRSCAGGPSAPRCAIQRCACNPDGACTPPAAVGSTAHSC